MDKMQRKELRQAENEINRGQAAKDAIKVINPYDFRRETRQQLTLAQAEQNRAFELAQIDAEKAFHVVETYGEKVEASRLRVEAILGR